MNLIHNNINDGEKFYNLYDFIYSIKGLGFINEDVDYLFYDEIIKQWFPIYYL